MKTSAAGTIVTGAPPPRQHRPRVYWHVTKRPPPAGYYEARPWAPDPITREPYEGGTKLLACSLEGITNLLPRGVEPAGEDGAGGEWFAAGRGARAMGGAA